MNTIKFHTSLYPKEVLFLCREEYAPYFHGVQDEEGEYIQFTYPEEEKSVAFEFLNYVLAAVRNHANR